jgi:hypothetical protein
VTDKEAFMIYECVVSELLRLETLGKDDHRDSWMGNAIKAVRRLEEHHRLHYAAPNEVKEKP